MHTCPDGYTCQDGFCRGEKNTRCTNYHENKHVEFGRQCASGLVRNGSRCVKKTKVSKVVPYDGSSKKRYNLKVKR